MVFREPGCDLQEGIGPFGVLPGTGFLFFGGVVDLDHFFNRGLDRDENFAIKVCLKFFNQSLNEK